VLAVRFNGARLVALTRTTISSDRTQYVVDVSRQTAVAKLTAESQRGRHDNVVDSFDACGTDRRLGSHDLETAGARFVPTPASECVPFNST
jgi:hypothetical protein